jgi:tetratricopeptide (TPR) repeat protein/tRNA A-37 threonylcarbamoyl transferase component Bud32
MGVVYMAEQEKPVRRRVALKVIKPGMDSAQVIARFEAERQALAMMDHLHIAKVFDAGTTATGRPFFVMELVHGVPITSSCDDNHLTPRERLALFIPVCQAIQHAHQKGVIHRDVKPSNVLVTLYDGRPVPKVIDFGVAKATEQRLTERTMFTQYGTLVGTLEYMSPEQAEMSGLGVDTRSDIYSLGVLLYELLTGSTPLDRRRLKEVAYAEVLRMIKEEEAPSPSTRLSGSGEALATIAARRRTEPARLTRLVRGELDWIVGKALEKDRTRRYETAAGLARDVERYLADEAVEACPPSALYKLRKFASKYRTPLRVAGVFALLLLLGVVTTTWLAVRAMVAERQALAERDAKEEALQKAEGSARQARAAAAAEEAARLDEAAQRRRAVESERRARAVLSFLQEKILAAGRPEGQEGGLGKDVTLRKSIDAAAPGIAAAFEAQPLVEASVRNALGETYLYLGEPALAIPHHERARALRQRELGTDHPDTLESMNNLAAAYYDAGRRDPALALFEETLKRRRATLGPEHPDTLTSMNNLAAAYHASGKPDRAVVLHQEALGLMKTKLGPKHPDTLNSMGNLALAYYAAGRRDLALPLFEESVKFMKAELGPEHPRTLRGMRDLTSAYQAAGKRDLALPLFEEAVKLMRVKLGPEHPITLGTMHGLALTYLAAAKADLAVPLFEETLEGTRTKLGPVHPRTLRGMRDLASAYQAAGKADLAQAQFQKAVRLMRTELGPDHPTTLGTMHALARPYWRPRGDAGRGVPPRPASRRGRSGCWRRGGRIGAAGDAPVP